MTILFVLLACSVIAQVNNIQNERLQVSQQFALAFKNGLTNEQIMKNYVVDGNYFKSDSARRIGDQWMDDLRKSYKSVNENDFVALPYIGHEDEFVVLHKGKMQRLEFILGTNDGQRTAVDLNDLYVVKIKSKPGPSGELFILFNDENKILSFAGYAIGAGVGLWQF